MAYRTKTCPTCGGSFSYEVRKGSDRKHCSAACRVAHLLEHGHPLANSRGNVYEHRKVMYDKVGNGPISCFWCAVGLTWPDAVVDHLNEVKGDNRPDNLVISCNDCNRARGSLIPFVKRMRQDAVDVFCRAVCDLNGTVAADEQLRLTA